MALEWKKCQWKSALGNDVEYSDLKTGSKFVSLRKEGGMVKELVSKPGDLQAKFQMKDRSREILDISYPGYDVNVNSKPAAEKDKYYLVVDHTRKTAAPVEKVHFHEFYADVKGGGKPKGDKNVSQSDHSSNPDEDKKQKGKNKELEKRK